MPPKKEVPPPKTSKEGTSFYVNWDLWRTGADNKRKFEAQKEHDRAAAIARAKLSAPSNPSKVPSSAPQSTTSSPQLPPKSKTLISLKPVESKGKETPSIRTKGKVSLKPKTTSASESKDSKTLSVSETKEPKTPSTSQTKESKTSSASETKESKTLSASETKESKATVAYATEEKPDAAEATTFPTSTATRETTTASQSVDRDLQHTSQGYPPPEPTAPTVPSSPTHSLLHPQKSTLLEADWTQFRVKRDSDLTSSDSDKGSGHSVNPRSSTSEPRTRERASKDSSLDDLAEKLKASDFNMASKSRHHVDSDSDEDTTINQGEKLENELRKLLALITNIDCQLETVADTVRDKDKAAHLIATLDKNKTSLLKDAKVLKDKIKKSIKGGNIANLKILVPEDNDDDQPELDYSDLIKVLRPYNGSKNFRSFFHTLFRIGKENNYNHATYKQVMHYVLQDTALEDFIELEDQPLQEIVDYFVVRHCPPELPHLSLKKLENFSRLPGENLLCAMTRCKMLLRKASSILPPSVQDDPDPLLINKLFKCLGPETAAAVRKKQYAASKKGQFIPFDVLLQKAFDYEIINSEYGPPETSKIIPELDALNLNTTTVKDDDKIACNSVNIKRDFSHRDSGKSGRMSQFRNDRRERSRSASRATSEERRFDKFASNRPGLDTVMKEEKQASQSNRYDNFMKEPRLDLNNRSRPNSSDRSTSYVPKGFDFTRSQNYGSDHGQRPRSSDSTSRNTEYNRGPSRDSRSEYRSQYQARPGTPYRNRSRSASRSRYDPYKRQSSQYGDRQYKEYYQRQRSQSRDDPDRGRRYDRSRSRDNRPFNPEQSNLIFGHHIPLDYRREEGKDCQKCGGYDRRSEYYGNKEFRNGHYADQCRKYKLFNPRPCTICKSAGLTAFHYESECLHRYSSN